MTAYAESYQRALQEFDNLLWRLELVTVATNQWKSALAKTLEDLEQQSKAPFQGDGTTHRTDVLVVTALSNPELSAILNLDAEFRPVEVGNDASVYYRGRLTRGRTKVDLIAVAASDKGMSGTAIAAMKGIFSFWPRYVYMPGITAGLKSRTNIGDVIFADLSWDWGSGKLKRVKGREEFLPAPYQRRLDETFSSSAKQLEDDELFLSSFWEESSATKPDTCPKVRVGAMASGASVLQSSAAVKRVMAQHKDLLAIEMEAFSLMSACETCPQPRPKGIVAKAVCDNGDGKKNDKYRAFAADTSAFVFQEFALAHLGQSGD